MFQGLELQKASICDALMAKQPAFRVTLVPSTSMASRGKAPSRWLELGIATGPDRPLESPAGPKACLESSTASACDCRSFQTLPVSISRPNKGPIHGVGMLPLDRAGQGQSLGLMHF